MNLKPYIGNTRILYTIQLVKKSTQEGETKPFLIEHDCKSTYIVILHENYEKVKTLHLYIFVNFMKMVWHLHEIDMAYAD